jgi:hypothetical protein
VVKQLLVLQGVELEAVSEGGTEAAENARERGGEVERYTIMGQDGEEEVVEVGVLEEEEGRDICRAAGGEATCSQKRQLLAPVFCL